MKRYVVPFLKIVIPVAIIAWLLANVPEDQLQDLRARPKNWPLLGVAFLVAMIGISITFARWYLLVRALHLRFRMRDAFRLGFLGYLFNFVSFGSVGGDLFKAFFIAREQPGRRSEAVATVIVDRMVGLYALLVVTTLAILQSNPVNPTPAYQTIVQLTYLLTGIGGLAIVVVMVPGFTQGSFSEMLSELPRVGPIIQRILGAVRMYRNRKLTMAGIFAMSLAVHTLITLAVYLMVQALFTDIPTLGEHLIIVPLSNVAAALPFTPAGLGSFELAMDTLYQYVPQGGAGNVVGILVAFGFRLMTIGIATVGVVYYWTCRTEVRDLIQESQQTEVTPQN